MEIASEVLRQLSDYWDRKRAGRVMRAQSAALPG